MKEKLKILLVEDIKYDYIAMRRALDKSELDCKILWVKQGKDAIQHLCSASFDIVLIDYKLPDENGLELLKEIKKKKLDVPVVFVAASGNESIAAETIKLGAQDYIVKDPLGRYLEIIPDVIKKALTQWKIEQEQKISAEKLKRSEERYRAFIQSSSEGIWCFESAEPIPIDLDEDKIIELIYATGTLVECNNMMAQMYGFRKRENIIGTRLENLLVPTEKRNIEYLRNFIRNDFRLIDGESYEPDVKGKVHIYLNNLVGIIENGYLVRAWGTQRDITERKQAEQIQSVLYHIANTVNTTKNLDELFKSIQNYLGTVVDTTNFFVALYDKETDIISLPYHIDEKDKFTSFPAGKSLTAYVIKTGKPLLATEEVTEKLTEAGKVETIGAPSKIWLGVPLKIGNKVIGTMAVQSYTDASLYTEKDMEILEFVSDEIALAIDRKRAEEALRKSEEKYRLISETTSDLIALATLSLNPVFTYVSPSIKSFGYEIDDVIGKPCFDFVHPDDKKKLLPLLKKYVGAKSKKLFSGKDSDISEIIENRVIDKYGNWHYFQSTVNILGNQILIISKNITERKKAEQALQASEAQYHGIFDSATDSFLIFDLDGNIVEANPQACKMYGYPYRELVKLSGKDIVHPDYYHHFENFKNDVQKTGKFHTESVDVHKNGTTFNIEVRGTAFHYKGKKHLLAVIRDITERKKAEEALKKKNKELETFNRLTVGRELRMIELKKEVNELLEKLGKEAKYKMAE